MPRSWELETRIFMLSRENPFGRTFCTKVQVKAQFENSGNVQDCGSCDTLDTMCTPSGVIPYWGSRDLYTRAECRFGNQITLAQ